MNTSTVNTTVPKVQVPNIYKKWSKAVIGNIVHYVFKINILKLSIALCHDLTLEQSEFLYDLSSAKCTGFLLCVCTPQIWERQKKTTTNILLWTWSTHIYFLIKIKGSTINKSLRLKNKLRSFHQSSWMPSVSWFPFSVGCPLHPTISWRFNSMLYR